MTLLPVGLTYSHLGMVFVSRDAAKKLNAKDTFACLERHTIGDYGDIDDVDWKANDAAWKHGFPVVSSYADRKRNRFLIVTYPHREATTILLPDEY